MIENTVALCVMGDGPSLRYVLRSVEAVHKYVDEVHIQCDVFPKDIGNALQDICHNLQIHIVPWTDDFSGYRNILVNHATTGWVLVMDGDEVPSEEMAKSIRTLAAESQMGRKYNIVRFNALNQVVHEGTSEILDECIGSGKPCLHVNIKDIYHGNPHIWLKPYPWVELNTNLYYYHIKERGIELIRSVRNVFLGGGGDSQKRENQFWEPMILLCHRIGIVRFTEFISYLKRGGVAPELKEIMESMFTMDTTPTNEDVKDLKIFYVLLHPEEQWGSPLNQDQRAIRYMNTLKTQGVLNGHHRVIMEV